MRITWRAVELRLLLPILVLVPLGFAITNIALTGRADPGPLGLAIGSLWNVFSPDLVVVGGGFGAGAWRFLEEAALPAARGEALRPADESLRVVGAELGDDAGLVGAGLVGFEALDGVR